MRLLLAFFAALISVAAAAPAAQARQYTHNDGAGDMHQFQDQQP